MFWYLNITLEYRRVSCIKVSSWNQMLNTIYCRSVSMSKWVVFHHDGSMTVFTASLTPCQSELYFTMTGPWQYLLPVWLHVKVSCISPWRVRDSIYCQSDSMSKWDVFHHERSVKRFNNTHTLKDGILK